MEEKRNTGNTQWRRRFCNRTTMGGVFLCVWRPRRRLPLCTAVCHASTNEKSSCNLLGKVKQWLSICHSTTIFMSSWACEDMKNSAWKCFECSECSTRLISDNTWTHECCEPPSPTRFSAGGWWFGVGWVHNTRAFSTPAWKWIKIFQICHQNMLTQNETSQKWP